MQKQRILIVGGVAGGASCAARARRLSETAEIIVFERGAFVSFANCGLPYYVGKVIKKETDLLVATPRLFKNRFNIDVRVQHVVRSIDRQNQAIEVEDLTSGTIYRESYDHLVLSPGAKSIIPNIEGIDQPGIFTLRNIPDMRRIFDKIENIQVKSAVVVGGGFIGLEMTENLVARHMKVTIVEMQKQIMPVMDPEMVFPVETHLKKKGVTLRLGTQVNGFGQEEGKIVVNTTTGEAIAVDLVILAMGVRPEIDLAQKADLTIGTSGGILVNDRMQTSDTRIWAVGDAVEIKHFITGKPGLIPLAGPANRQGRLAADVILGHDTSELKFRGVQGTSVCGVLGMTLAATGISEKQITASKEDAFRQIYEKVYSHSAHHAGYYPGAETISLKLVFSRQDGKILGAQAIGKAGVEKRIDVIAMAIQKQGTVFDLEEAELCYAPQYGSAKDPVNIAGMIASNVIKGYSDLVHWNMMPANTPHFMLDVREPSEFKLGHMENAVNIPLGDLRARLPELPRDKEIWTYCFVGQRSYYANRILKQHGFQVRNLSGGYLTGTWVVNN